MERKRELADLVGIALIERRRDGVQEVGADAPLLVAQFDLACGVLHGLSDRQVELRSRGRACDPGKRESTPVQTLNIARPGLPQRCASTISATTAKASPLTKSCRLDRESCAGALSRRARGHGRPHYSHRRRRRERARLAARAPFPLHGRNQRQANELLDAGRFPVFGPGAAAASPITAPASAWLM